MHTSFGTSHVYPLTLGYGVHNVKHARREAGRTDTALKRGMDSSKVTSATRTPPAQQRHHAPPIMKLPRFAVSVTYHF